MWDMSGETLSWTVRSYECAPDGKVTVANICNYLQEAAALNAEHLGFSKSNFEGQGQNLTWVMTRMRLRLMRRPRWNDEVKVFTFPRPARRIVAWRDFVLSDAHDVEIGRASTEWMMIDMTTRRPVAIPAFVTERADLDREPVFAEPLGFKVAGETFDGVENPYAITAAPSDIDLNGHVNNVRYVTWLFDASGLTADALTLELAFKSEVLCGTTVRVETVRRDGILYQRICSDADHVLAQVRISKGGPAEFC